MELVRLPTPAPRGDAAAVAATDLMEKFRANPPPAPAGYKLLIAVYVRPSEKILPNGQKFFLTDKTRQEDIYQGRAGLVVALGSQAYTERDKFPKGPWCKVGDWVMWPAAENISSRFEYGDSTYCFVNDDRIDGVGFDPTLVK